MMLVLYILGGLLLFLLLLLAFLLFVRFRIHIHGKYSGLASAAEMECFWIKYFLGVRCSVHDLKNLDLRLWIFGIPVPLKLPLSKSVQDFGTAPAQPRFEKEKQAAEAKKPLRERFRQFDSLPERLKAAKEKHYAYLKRIFVRYITFSSFSLKAEIGFEDPAQTGMAAAIYYSTKTYAIPEHIDLNWNFQDAVFHADLKTKFSMKLYGICVTLLQLLLKIRKERKHESQ
ncbi:MAG: hypothetical protein WC372_07630 [Candidatus Neomarinimicrobiota bacterium]|jgi:hypothetical protein|nr:hypothetical protein [Candidatus Neomarinimicrobiota bacterium]